MSGYVLALDVGSDLDEIWEFIAVDDIDAADRWIAKLFDNFEVLAQTPGMGQTGRHHSLPCSVLARGCVLDRLPGRAQAH